MPGRVERGQRAASRMNAKRVLETRNPARCLRPENRRSGQRALGQRRHRVGGSLVGLEQLHHLKHLGVRAGHSAFGESSVILLHPPLPLVGVSIGKKQGVPSK